MSGSSLNTAWIPLADGAEAVYNSSGLAYDRHPDWLGSSRLASTQQRGVYFDTAYTPYGMPYGQSGSSDLSFTGQDAQIAASSTSEILYDFMFREYSPLQGRWIQPDRAGMNAVDLADPQSLNRYSYVENEPVSASDNSGRLLSLAEEQGWCDVDGTCNFTFGWANGASNYDMNPGDPCAYVGSIGRGDCQMAPGLWDNGNPITESGISIDFGGNPYGNLPGTDISVQNALSINLNNTQPCGDFAPCNDWINPYGIINWAGSLFGSCFTNFLKDTAMNVFDVKDLADAAAVFSNIRRFDAALAYAESKGLMYPFQSSVFRGILEGGSENALGLLTVDYGMLRALHTEYVSAENGQCQ